MSERRDMSGGAFFGLLLLLILSAVAFIMIGSQLKDAQRRIAVLEQRLEQLK